MSILGKLNPFSALKGVLGNRPWLRRLLWLAPVLIVLALLNPVLGTIDKLFSLVGRALDPLLNTGVGRAVLAVVVIGVALLLVYAFFKDRVKGAFRRYGLSQFLRGLEARLLGKPSDAGRYFRSVTRLGRFVDLSKGPASGHGSLVVAARLELARMQLARDDAPRARAELARIPRKQLAKRQRLALAELEARVATASTNAIPENVVRKLREAHQAWPAHAGIAMLLAERLEETGERDAASTVLRETLRKCGKVQALEVSRRLARVELRASDAALLALELPLAQKHVERALRLEESEEALLQKANILLAKEDLDGALRILGELGTPAANARARELLRAHDVPVDAARVLERMPKRASLLALAEHYYQEGELGRARRALEIALREAETPSPRALALLASIRMEEDDPDEASAALGRALHALGGGAQRASDDEG